jgi:outer membrane biosynthesis protein TonB
VFQTLEKEDPLSIRADRRFNDTLLFALRSAAGRSGIDSAAFASGLAAPVEEQPDSLDPAVIKIPTPIYPARLASSGVRGLVLVRYVIGADGSTETGSIEPLWASHREFIPAVEDAVARGQFRPARLKGQPVRRRVYQYIYFRQQGMQPGWN